MNICVITNSNREIDLIDRVRVAFKRLGDNVSMVQLREFWLQEVLAEEAMRLVSSCVDLCREHGAKLIANSATPRELWSLADGVHLSDKTVEMLPEVRREYGNTFVVGYSAHSVDEALNVVERYPSLDYLFLSPIFKPISKTSERESLGLEPLKELCSKVTCPVYALGGIRAENAYECVAAGAYGVGGISLALE